MKGQHIKTYGTLNIPDSLDIANEIKKSFVEFDEYIEFIPAKDFEDYNSFTFSEYYYKVARKSPKHSGVFKIEAFPSSTNYSVYSKESTGWQTCFSLFRIWTACMKKQVENAQLLNKIRANGIFTKEESEIKIKDKMFAEFFNEILNYKPYDIISSMPSFIEFMNSKVDEKTYKNLGNLNFINPLTMNILIEEYSFLPSRQFDIVNININTQINNYIEINPNSTNKDLFYAFFSMVVSGFGLSERNQIFLYIIGFCGMLYSSFKLMKEK